MAKNGYVSINREIQNHWIFKEKRVFSKFEAWIYLIMDVNHSPGKVPIGNQIVELKRGQTLTSILKLSEIFSWSRFKVKSFLTLLENDGMIEMKTTTKYTLLTIVNYDFYQSDEGRKKHQKNINQTSEQQQHDINQTSEQQQTNTNNKNNNNNKKNNDNKAISSSNNDDFRTVVSMYQENIELNPAPVTFQKIQQDFSDYGKDIMIYAIEKSALKNNHNYSFINFLLNDWKKKQLITVDEIKQSEHNFEFKKQSTYSKQNQQKEMTPSWINQENTQKQDIDEEELERERQKLLEELNSNWENS